MQTALWKGRATIYISVAIKELFRINHCFVFVFLYIFNIPRKSLFRFRRKQHWLQFSVMYLPNQQFILFHVGGEYCWNVTCLAILFLKKLGGLLRLIHRVGVVRILSPKFPLFRTAPLFHVNCWQLNNQLNNIFLAKFPNWRGFCGGNHWTLFLQPTWKYEHRMVYLSKLSIKTSMFRALYFRWHQWNGMFPIETTFVAHDNNEVLTVKLRHKTSLVAYSTDKRSKCEHVWQWVAPSDLHNFRLKSSIWQGHATHSSCYFFFGKKKKTPLLIFSETYMRNTKQIF